MTTRSGENGSWVQLEEVLALSRRILPRMWSPSSRLFCHKTLIGPDGAYFNRGENPLYSAISLIGLVEDGLERDPELSGVLGPTLDALWSCHERRFDPALCGCLMWAGSLVQDARVVEMVRALGRGPEARTIPSIALGLLLSGLARAHAGFPQLRAQVVATAAPLRDELIIRFRPRAGVFVGRPRGFDPAHPIRAYLTNFASQVYPIHGLAELARCTEQPIPGQAVSSADRLVERQGSRGQWWWQYSLGSGRVIEAYPVYSVHQHAMAFMALVPVHAAAGRSYDEPLRRGLRWLFGENELHQSLIAQRPETIARCVQRIGSDPDAFAGISRLNRVKALLASYRLAPAGGGEADSQRLEILHESRPYEFGWALYAGSLVRTHPIDASRDEGP